MRNFPAKLFALRFHLQSQWLIALAAFYFTTVPNLALWRYFISHLEITGTRAFFFGISMPVFIFTAIFLFFNLLPAYFIKPVLIVLLLISSVTSYFMLQLGVFIDADMIRNAFETNTREAFDLVTFRMILWSVLGGIVPSCLIAVTRIEYRSFWKESFFRLIAISGCLLVIGLISAFFYREYADFSKRHREMTKLINPSSYIYGSIRYWHLESFVFKAFMSLDKDAELKPYDDARHTVFIMVVGETARGKNFSLNGYPRETNPLLAKEDIISFKNFYSCGTATAISVPCMFSHQPQKSFNIQESKFSENLIDLIKQTGFEVLWRENDDGCKGVCNRIPTDNLYKSRNSRYCDGESCFDEILVDGLEEYLSGLKKDAFIVLHTIGSHGPTYYKRYPGNFRQFTPTCDTADIRNCSHEQIVNTYDNTILYTDFVVSRAIHILRKFPHLESGLLYVSDHGESLGEKTGMYLHGTPYDIAPEEQKKVPMILWMSENMKKFDHLDYSCIAKKAEENTFSHDNLYHTLLALMEIRSKTYDKSLDMFDSCRLEPLP